VQLPCGTCGYHVVMLHWEVRAVTMRYVRLPCGNVTLGGTCSYHAVRAVTMRRTFSVGCLTLQLAAPPVLFHVAGMLDRSDRGLAGRGYPEYCSGFVDVLRKTYTHVPGYLITFRTEFELWNTRMHRCMADELRRSADTKMNRRSFPVRSEAEN
jgi:hypothetical protein